MSSALKQHSWNDRNALQLHTRTDLALSCRIILFNAMVYSCSNLLYCYYTHLIDQRTIYCNSGTELRLSCLLGSLTRMRLPWTFQERHRMPRSQGYLTQCAVMQDCVWLRNALKCISEANFRRLLVTSLKRASHV